MPFDPTVLLSTYWDALDVDAFVDCYADDASWSVNTAPAVTGKEAIKDLAKMLLGTSKASRHHDLQVIVQPSSPRTVVLHGAVEYELEGKEDKVTCRFCDVFEMSDDDKIAKCFTYMDTAPLLA